MGKRELIIDTALTVIAEEGLGGFTQPRVSQRAGIRQSHLTYYFPTRDDLLFAVAEEAVRRRVSSFRVILDARDATSKLDVLVDILSDPSQTRVLIALVQGADARPEIRASFAELSAGLVPIGADLLQAFEIEVSVTNLALLRTLGTGLAVQALAEGSGESKARAKALLRQFLADSATNTTQRA